MFCNYCGGHVQQADRFCNSCGHELFVNQNSKATATTYSGENVISKVISAGSRVRKQVLGTREKKYPFSIDAEGLIKQLVSTFENLGYSVWSVQLPSEQQPGFVISKQQQQQDQGKIISYVVEIKKLGTAPALIGENSLAVRIRVSKSSTLVSLGITHRAAALRLIFLPTKGYNDQNDVSSKIWGVVDDYMKTFEFEEGGVKVNSKPFSNRVQIDSLFVGREKEIEEFSMALESTLRRKPKHLAITGGAGIGKSTLLREFQEIALQKQLLCVRREFDPSLASLQDIALFLVDSLDRESLRKLPRTLKLTDKMSRFVNDHGITMPTFFGFGGGGITAQRVTNVPSVLQEKTFEFLKTRAVKLIEQGVPGVVFLLDDADRLNQVAGAWSFLRTLFYRLNEELGYFMLVVAGSSLFRRGGLENQTVRRLFTISQLEPFSKVESDLFLLQIFSDSGIKLASKAFEAIHELSGGHPVILELFASEILENNDSTTQLEIQRGDIQRIRSAIVSKLSEGFFWDRYEDTTTEEKRVLEVLSGSNEPLSLKKLGSALKTTQMNVKAALNGLIEKGLVTVSNVRKEERENGEVEEQPKYSIFSPLFAQYVTINSEIKLVR
jgi:hypothetical protein